MSSASAVLEEASLEPLVNGLRVVRARTSFPDEVVVAALAGGTGSGKSSLFNALVGEELADVGGVRPTTQKPAAAVPSGASGRFDGYLDSMAVDTRFHHSGAGFLLIDLPDTDSTAVEHKHRVDEILPLVDVVVWVVDPEKYRDARLHAEYLRPLAPYGSQFVFVVNQIDRLHPSDLETLKGDFADALAKDGIDDPMIFAVAAMPPSGPPIGVDDLVAELEHRGANRESVTNKLLVDLAETAKALSDELGGGVDFDKRASVALDSAVKALVQDHEQEAVSALVGLLDDLSGDVETVTSAHLRRLAADVPAHVARIVEEIEPSEQPTPRWPRKKPTPTPPDAERARALLSEAVIRPARAVLAKRALAIASVAELGLDLERRRQLRPQ